MPLFTFKCGSCNNEQTILAQSGTKQLDCSECEGKMDRQLPRGTSSTTYVGKDRYRGVQHKKNLEGQLTERMRRHHDKYEIEEKIDDHGVDTAKKFGWFKKRIKV